MAYQPAWLRRLSALRQAGPPHILVDRFFDTTYDFPPTTQKRGAYLIATTPRSGSHYLGHLLFSTKQLGAPLEYLSAANFGRWCELIGSSDPRVVYGEIMARRTSPNGWFGLQAHWYHLANLARFRIPHDLIDVHKIIWIMRRDLVEQAISLAIGLQTGSWTVFHKPSRAPTYDRVAIADCLEAIQQMNRAWARHIKRSGLPHLQLFYEDICANENETVQQILDWFELPKTEQITCVGLQKQADRLNIAWKQRFLSELAANT